MLRTHTCGEASASLVGKEVTLCGWVHRRRDHGQLTFIDLRDRYGLTQVVAHEKENAAAHAALGDARNEWVLRVRGTVRARPEGTKNPRLATGEVEVVATEVTVLNASKTPPFYVNEETEVDENLRWKYRYVDLRRERSKDLMRLRHEVVAFIRRHLIERGFWEIETPTLIRSDPTGARDFIVPSRYYPGRFWAQPQSPQQYKQILMVGGLDKYFQIAHCYRDEDPRADRVYEHTQLDLEMSFVDREDVMATLEGLYTEIFRMFARKPLAKTPVPRMTYEEAIRRFGIDRPDLRFAIELVDLTDALRGTSFNAFRSVIDSGGAVRGLVVPGKADATRKDIDGWQALAKTKGAKGLVSFAFSGNPFCAPLTEHDIALLDTDPEKAKSKQYDFAIDGKEIFGGSVRIYQRAVQERVFAQLGVSKEDAATRFGALLDALEYGAPPSGGVGAGIDRLCMTPAGTENIREGQSFPKTPTGYDPAPEAPAAAAPKPLDELGLRVGAQPEKRA